MQVRGLLLCQLQSCDLLFIFIAQPIVQLQLKFQKLYEVNQSILRRSIDPYGAIMLCTQITEACNFGC